MLSIAHAAAVSPAFKHRVQLRGIGFLVLNGSTKTQSRVWDKAIEGTPDVPENAVGRSGEYASSPTELPKRGWKQILFRVKDQILDNNLSVVSAGVAFLAMLAMFPGLAVMVTIYGLIADPYAVQDQLSPLRDIMPPDAYQVIADQLKKVTGETDTKLGVGLMLSFALAIWSATRGIEALITAMNIAYKEGEKRGFVIYNLTATLLTVGAVFFVILSFTLIRAIPAAIEMVHLGEPLASIALWIRWPVLIALLVLALAIIYRYGPSRANARLQWITPGAIAASILWLFSSVAFSFYVSNFGKYNETFGSLGAAVILLFWFYISAYVVCLGAELNAELEHQTNRDSTTGPSRAAPT